MPVIEVHLLEGYAAEARGRLARALTGAVRLVVPAPAEAITVITHEMDAASYMRGGVARTGAPALPDPVATIRAFLTSMEERDLEAARSHLGEGFVMRFPGAPAMTALEDLVAWAAPRYRFVKKTYGGFDVALGDAADDASVVYCRGALSGEWPNGDAFSGVRFIDRFELRGGLITAQDVWNDVAEVRS
ncbi:MAG: tautomerase family protein [Pseudomonadota bacterium]